MSNRHQQQVDLESAEVSKVALRVFFRIARAWRLTDEQAQALLSVGSRFRLDDEQQEISGQTLERISHVFGVYKDLRQIFPNEYQACEWIHKPNSHFDGQAAFTILTKDPSVVRRYLASFANT